MKIAAGCFGCLAFVFLALSMLTGTLLSMVAAADPGIAADLAPFTAYMQYANGGCCCMSTMLTPSLPSSSPSAKGSSFSRID